MGLDSFYLDNRGVFRAAALERFDWLEHGFGTQAPSAWPDLSRLAMLKQIHSARVVLARDSMGIIGEGDALITDRPGLLVSIRTADCVPILIVDSRNRAVAAVHAGWRGTAQGIVIRSISELARHFGTSPKDVYVAIGPAIGPCCYEVGPEVARKFAQWWPELDGASHPIKLDLAATNYRQLVGTGVEKDKIATSAPCTCCTDTLHSYRRDKHAAGRMISAIGIRTEN